MFWGTVATSRGFAVWPMVVTVVACLQSPALALRLETPEWQAAENLILQAHAFDPNYSEPRHADRDRAIAHYRDAFEVSTDYSQRLHALYRMAQLHGVNYSAADGEKPNFAEAIRLSKRIVDEYPPHEPLVVKAMNSIGSFNLAMGNPVEALVWFKRALEFDTDRLEASLAPPAAGRLQPPALTRSELYPEADTSRMSAYAAAQQLHSLHHYQRVAVKMVGATAWRIDHALFEPEMKRIAQQYSGRAVAEIASQRLAKARQRLRQVDPLPEDELDRPHVPLDNLDSPHPRPATSDAERVPTLPNTQQAGDDNTPATDPHDSPRRWQWWVVAAVGIAGTISAIILITRRKQRGIT